MLFNITLFHVFMLHFFSTPFLEICHSIVEENLTESEWAEVESCDMFQNGPYIGGFEAIENAFCFSFYDENGVEYWFQMTLEEIKSVADGSVKEVMVYPPLD
jgi:hypothetical protein